jgi:hypothetical protein
MPNGETIIAPGRYETKSGAELCAMICVERYKPRKFSAVEVAGPDEQSGASEQEPQQSGSRAAHGSHSGVESVCPCCEGLREVWAYSTNAGCFAFQPCPRCDGSGSAPPYASPNENSKFNERESA